MSDFLRESHVKCEGITSPLPIYCHATVHNQIAYISGIQGFIPGTFDFPSDNAKDQARQVLKNMEVVLTQVGSTMAHVLKITIFMTEMDYFSEINDAVNEIFQEAPPARSSIAVACLPKGAKVAIEAIAATRE